MPRVSTYLNFMGTTEEAFNSYRSLFGTEPRADLPDGRHAPFPRPAQLSEAEKEMVMHVELPILAGHVIMGTDMLESLGHERRRGDVAAPLSATSVHLTTEIGVPEDRG